MFRYHSPFRCVPWQPCQSVPAGGHWRIPYRPVPSGCLTPLPGLLSSGAELPPLTEVIHSQCLLVGNPRKSCICVYDAVLGELIHVLPSSLFSNESLRKICFQNQAGWHFPIIPAPVRWIVGQNGRNVCSCGRKCCSQKQHESRFAWEMN